MMGRLRPPHLLPLLEKCGSSHPFSFPFATNVDGTMLSQVGDTNPLSLVLATLCYFSSIKEHYRHIVTAVSAPNTKMLHKNGAGMERNLQILSNSFIRIDMGNRPYEAFRIKQRYSNADKCIHKILIIL